MKAKKDRFLFFFLLIILTGVYFFIFGDSGLIERIRLQEEKDALTKRIENQNKEAARLRKLYEGYKNGDFNKEEAVKAGYIDKGEKLIFFDESKKDKQKKIEVSENEEKDRIDIMHLRILWVVVSMMIILFYLGRKSRYKEE